MLVDDSSSSSSAAEVGLTLLEEKVARRSFLPEPPGDEKGESSGGGGGVGIQALAATAGLSLQGTLVNNFLLVWTDQVVLLTFVMVMVTAVAYLLRQIIDWICLRYLRLTRARPFFLFVLDVVVYAAGMATIALVMITFARSTLGSGSNSTPAASVIFFAMMLITVAVGLLWLSSTYGIFFASGSNGDSGGTAENKADGGENRAKTAEQTRRQARD